MRVVPDTSVVVSATLIQGGNEDRILRFWQRGAFDVVLSPPILEEIGRALLYEKIQKFRWMSEEEIQANVASGALSRVQNGFRSQPTLGCR